LVLFGAAALERPLDAQNRTVVIDTVRTPDSLAQRRELDRQAHERIRQLLSEAGAYYRAGDRRMEGVRLRQTGNVYLRELNVLDSALTLYQRARELARAVGNRWDEFNAEYNIRVVQSNRTYADSALVFWHEALSIARRAGDRTAEGEVLLRISSFYQSFDSTLTYAKLAAEIARELADRWESGQGAFHAVGVAYLRLARLDSAEVYLRESLRRARVNRDQAAEGWALNELASVYATRGHFDSTLVLFHAARERFHAAGESDGEPTVLYNIGEAQSSLGRSDSVLFYFHQSRDKAHELGLVFVELNVLNGIGGALLSLGHADSAVAYFREALRIGPEVGDTRTIAYTLRGLGDAQHALGQTDSALSSLRRSLALHHDLGTRDAAAAVLGSIGTVHRDVGHRDSALVNYREGLALARAAEARETEIALLGNLGELHYRDGGSALGTAVAYFDSAAALRATFAAHTGNDPTKVSYAEQGTELYEHWVLAWLGREDEVGREASYAAALAAAERGRAQALLDLLRRGQGGDSAKAAALGEPAQALGADLDLVREGRDLITSVRTMGTPTLAYAATKDTLVTWLILPSGEIAVDRQPVPRDSVARLVSVIRSQLGADEALGRTVRSLEPNDGMPPRDRRTTASGQRSATRRSRALFDAAVVVLVPASLTSRLPPGGELVVVPHGPLALVSFAALPVGSAHERSLSGESLGTRYAIRYAPSLTALRLVTARDDARPFRSRAGRESVGPASLVVGNPAMPRVPVARGGTARLPSLAAAEREGVWVAQALGARALTGGAATERIVRARMAGAPVIHLATHGFAYSADAKVLDSFVALAPDSAADGAGNGLLTVGEVIDDVPRLTAELVVLSACQTGLGNLKQAEGTVGLQRAFLAKGARSVLVSLWSVSDRATELLMRGFYTHWLRDADNPGKAEALRRAQEDVRRAPGLADPRYWAAFQLVGAP